MRQLLVGALALVVGIGAASDGGSAAVPANPCAYASAADVGSAVGGPVMPGIPTPQGPQMGDYAAGCIYMPRATFSPVGNAGFEYARLMFLDPTTFAADTRAHPYFVNVFPVSGLGDRAYSVVGSHYEVVFVRKGDYRIAFEVAAGLGSFIDPELRLARIVVPRLPA